MCLVPTSVESFAVGEEGELEEQRAQKICPSHYSSHLIDMERKEGEKQQEQQLFIN